MRSGSTAWKPAGDEDPLSRIVVTLLLTVGLPYFVLSSSGPLLQAWHWRLHRERSPYPLYALSNADSLLALVSYPFLVEPLLRLQQQTWSWSWGYVGLFALMGLCVLMIWRRLAKPPAAAATSVNVPFPLLRYSLWCPTCANEVGPRLVT